LTSAGSHETGKAGSGAEQHLIVDLEGFEGPLDLLLQLAREQKVDLVNISILALAEQYLDFLRRAPALRLEVAANYLVMAAWLILLKSRLLLPNPVEEEEPSAAEMAAALRFHLQRLQAMQERGRELQARPQLGRERIARGQPEEFLSTTKVIYDVSLYDLLTAYGGIAARQGEAGLSLLQLNLYCIEEAVSHLKKLLAKRTGWHELMAFLPDNLRDDLERRSALASSFTASLELCRDGAIELSQDRAFGPLLLRARPSGGRSPAG